MFLSDSGKTTFHHPAYEINIILLHVRLVSGVPASGGINEYFIKYFPIAHYILKNVINFCFVNLNFIFYNFFRVRLIIYKRSALC